MRDELDEIRLQFDCPDEKITEYLNYAEYDFDANPQRIATGGKMGPFEFEGTRRGIDKLTVRFRRSKAVLPPSPIIGAPGWG